MVASGVERENIGDHVAKIFTKIFSKSSPLVRSAAV